MLLRSQNKLLQSQNMLHRTEKKTSTIQKTTPEMFHQLNQIQKLYLKRIKKEPVLKFDWIQFKQQNPDQDCLRKLKKEKQIKYVWVRREFIPEVAEQRSKLSSDNRPKLSSDSCLKIEPAMKDEPTIKEEPIIKEDMTDLIELLGYNNSSLPSPSLSLSLSSTTFEAFDALKFDDFDFDFDVFGIYNDL